MDKSGCILKKTHRDTFTWRNPVNNKRFKVDVHSGEILPSITFISSCPVLIEYNSCLCSSTVRHKTVPSLPFYTDIHRYLRLHFCFRLNVSLLHLSFSYVFRLHRTLCSYKWKAKNKIEAAASVNSCSLIRNKRQITARKGAPVQIRSTDFIHSTASQSLSNRLSSLNATRKFITYAVDISLLQSRTRAPDNRKISNIKYWQ